MVTHMRKGSPGTERNHLLSRERLQDDDENVNSGYGPEVETDGVMSSVRRETCDGSSGRPRVRTEI